jgi:hypothetical protein
MFRHVRQAFGPSPRIEGAAAVAFLGLAALGLRTSLFERF